MWLNEYQARACPACAGDARAIHIHEACALEAQTALRTRLAESEAEVGPDSQAHARMVARALAAEARLSAATRVVEAAGAVLDNWFLPPASEPWQRVRTELREWKEGSK